MKAVVMAGGEGSRLRPITANRPKPLVPVCNQPIMEHILTLLKRHGITDVVATVHFLAHEIQSYFGDGSEFGVSLSYSVEDTPLGTAGSVKKAESLIVPAGGPSAGGPFLIISGDALTDCDLSRALEFHRQKGSLATLILYRVPNPLEFGVVITDEEGRIERFLEKPSWSEVFSDTVNTGMYILEPEIFQYMEPGRQYDWSQNIFPQLLRDGKPMYGYVMEEYWTDIGSLTQYREAQEHLLAGAVDLPILGDEKHNGIYTGGNCSIEPGAQIVPPVCIGRNCKIKSGARVGPYTVMGDNAFVESGACIERSVIWDSAYVGPNVDIQSAIVGSRVAIKRDTVLQEDSVVGDRCLIDVGCTIRPRIKLWPDKIIERGSTVTMSLIWGNKWRGNLFRDLGVAGLSNIEITPDFATRLGSAFGSILPPKSKVVTSRDSTRSSRMIKRAVVASLLSVGCDVLDLRSAPVPVARHFIKTSGAAGAVNVRKLPGNSRVTLIEMFDAQGGYLSKAQQRKVETAFFREDFKRIDPDDLGVIEFGLRALEDYQADYFQLLGEATPRRLKIVCDYGYSALGSLLPAMLSRLGVESISLNAYNDAKLAPRSEPEVAKHVENLRHIAGSLGYDMGVLFTDEGERLTVVDRTGQVLSGNTLFAALGCLVAKTHKEARIAMSVAGPSRVEEFLQAEGARILRTKADTPALMTDAMDHQATFAGDDRGGFIFPSFHPGFDGAFTLGKLIVMLQQTGADLHDLALQIPHFELAYEQVHCPWEAKGAVMRHITEEQADDARVELVDGIKIYENGSWVLVLPDSVEPLFHIYAEAHDGPASKDLVTRYAKKIGHLAQSEA
jgi:mannose-1-phosphate guanylyltransferase / phosphomannomutase